MTEQYRYTSEDIARIIQEARWHIDSKQTNAGEHLIAIIQQMRATVEAQAARIGALESENARLRAALEDDDRSVEASIAYLNSTSGGTKNDVPDDRSEGE